VQRLARLGGLVLAATGVLALAWVVLVWQWQDPFTAGYTLWQQHELEGQLSKEFRDYGLRHRTGASAEADTVARAAARFRRAATTGEAIGRIVIPRLGLNMILVNGTDDASLELGPARDERSYMPGEKRLVYVAGHRTTFLAPFANIDEIAAGDPITLEMPYATFVYRAVRHTIVPATDLAPLRSPRHELLELQACNPRFFATQRWIVYARLVTVAPRYRASVAGRRFRTASNGGRPSGPFRHGD
jgi:sortase A